VNEVSVEDHYVVVAKRQDQGESPESTTGAIGSFESTTSAAPLTESTTAEATTTAASEPLPPVPKLLSVADEASKIRLLCFGWTALKGREPELLNYVRKLWQGCDGHAFFTDMDAQTNESTDIYKVEVPKAMHPREHEWWLKYKNMIGLAPAWQYMFDQNLLANFNWAINLELDHWVSPTLVKQSIAQQLQIIQEGTKQDPTSKPIMLNFGNAFAFNKALMNRMKEAWPRLSVPLNDDKWPALLGCPTMDRIYEPDESQCPQDTVYPAMIDKLGANVSQYGPTGCSQTLETFGKDLPLACWQDYPLGYEEPADQIRNFEELAKMRTFATWDEAKQYCNEKGGDLADEGKCKQLYRAKSVPIIHWCKSVMVHEAAQKYLGQSS
jgi:hypothetical protein